MKKTRLRTFWECEHCHTAGMIDHDAHADAWTVIQAIAAAHREAHGEFERPCRHGIGDIRVHIGPVRAKRKPRRLSDGP